MIRQIALVIAVSSALAIASQSAFADDTNASRAQMTQQNSGSMHEQMYGSQLMTQQERLEYREKMRNMKTEQERAAFRLEHHKQMQQRALERGVGLPDMPPAQGQGMMQGQGMGPGQGKGR